MINWFKTNICHPISRAWSWLKNKTGALLASLKTSKSAKTTKRAASARANAKAKTKAPSEAASPLLTELAALLSTTPAAA